MTVLLKRLFCKGFVFFLSLTDPGGFRDGDASKERRLVVKEPLQPQHSASSQTRGSRGHGGKSLGWVVRPGGGPSSLGVETASLPVLFPG